MDDLGTTLLDVVYGDPERVPEIGGIVIHDPADPPELPSNALVLGVGLIEPDEVAAVLLDAGRHGAAGLVLRAPVRADAALRAAAEESGVVVLGLSRGAAWAQVAAMLRSLLAEGDVGVEGPETLGGMPSGDLFAVANAIAALLDAPVTIEDRNARVLAFSGRQDEADPSRVETILGRQVPERYIRILTDRGVFQDLYRSAEPVEVEPVLAGDDSFSLPRVAIAVRAGDEVLGSIWVAVHEALSDERLTALSDAAKLVALHLLRLRAGEDVQRRLVADLMSTAIEGGPEAREALHRLGLADQPVIVLGVAAHASSADEAPAAAARARGRQRLSDAFIMHLSAAHPRSAAALIGDVTYGLVPAPRGALDGEERAVRIATEFLDRIGDQFDVLAGVGHIAEDVGGLSRARVSVDRVLRVLREGRSGRRIARMSDIQAEAQLLEMRDLAALRGDEPTPPLARLIEYDLQHNAKLVETLSMWLNHFGDISAAAAAVYVHPNTFRYRVRRLVQVSGMDLDDPETRFNAMVQLRVVL